MKIHTSLTSAEMYALTRGLPVSYHDLSGHGSRTAPRAFNVRLTGTGGLSNTGLYGAGDYSGATWDEWGAYFGRLYLADPAAVCGGSAARPVYAVAEDFHWQTGGRFKSGEMPADTHPRHRWNYSGNSVTGSYAVHECGKCSAVTRRLTRSTWQAFTAAVSA